MKNRKEYFKAYREANKDKIAEQKKAYYEANKDKIKAYREANKDKIAEQKKAYYEANKDKFKSYRKANKKKIAEYHKAYREANKEKIAEKTKSYYEANKEKIAEYYKAYREANKDKINAKERKITKELQPIKNKLKEKMLNEIYQRVKEEELGNQSPTYQTSPNGDFSNEKEHNISLKDNSNELSQISSNDETSLNNNNVRRNF
jgi:hypothetical protein